MPHTTSELRIHWEIYGGKGHSSPSPVSEEMRLQSWTKTLQEQYPHGVFTVRVHSVKDISQRTRDVVRELM